MPPIRHFKALPQPLRAVLGMRALAMDRTLGVVAERLGVAHAALPTEALRKDPEQFFARDRLHPSALGYSELGRCVGPVMRKPALRRACQRACIISVTSPAAGPEGKN